MLTKQWFLVGSEKYFFPAALLNKVLESHRKIGTVPKGYHYPELHQRRCLPIDMIGFEERKRRHQDRARANRF